MKFVRGISLLLIASVLFVTMPVLIRAQSQQDIMAERVRVAAAKIGSGPKSKVEVKTRKGDRVKGYIESIQPDSVTIVEDKGGTRLTITFAEIDNIKKQGGLGKASIIALAAIGVAAAIITGLFIERCRNEMGCGAGH